MDTVVTFLAHSGFTVALGDWLLVFDAAMGAQPREVIRAARRPVVFVSHRHGDHFHPRIGDWRALNPALRYVVSDDVEGLPGAVRLAPGEMWREDGLRVRTVRSTDEGVAFRVEAEGIRIFHAGDLNDWHWRDESTPQEAAAAHAAFADILSGLRGEPVDIAFFPVDPRLGGGYDDGARAFCRQIAPTHFFAMHFGSRFDAAESFGRWAGAACPEVTVHDIRREGQTFRLELKEEKP